jgi:hypothetical protein
MSQMPPASCPAYRPPPNVIGVLYRRCSFEMIVRKWIYDWTVSMLPHAHRCWQYHTTHMKARPTSGQLNGLSYWQEFQLSSTIETGMILIFDKMFS